MKKMLTPLKNLKERIFPSDFRHTEKFLSDLLSKISILKQNKEDLKIFNIIKESRIKGKYKFNTRHVGISQQNVFTFMGREYMKNLSKLNSEYIEIEKTIFETFLKDDKERGKFVHFANFYDQYKKNKFYTYILIFLCAIYFSNYLRMGIKNESELNSISEGIGSIGSGLDKYIYKENEKHIRIRKNITDKLEDVKGIDEVKDEIEEIVKMYSNPSLYEDAGVKLIRGILLIGKPGTGKTLLARALAGETKCNFLYYNASEFDQALVGAGSKSIKSIFEIARKNTPCIIFIDEIDSLIHKSHRSGIHSSSYDRQTINTFLSELDGFKKKEHIFILGATNAEKDLDPAALRPGRFDKIIHVPVSDLNGREELFELYLKQVIV